MKKYFIYAILAVIAIIIVLGIFFGFQYQKMNKEKAAQDEATRALINSQQQALKEAEQQIKDIQSKSASDNKLLQDKIAAIRPVVTETQTSTPSQKTLPDIITEWSSNVALVVCKYSDGSGAFGSGFLGDAGGFVSVLTNKHVITDKNGNGAVSCSVEIPGDGKNYYYADIDKSKICTDDLDWGYLAITTGDTYFNNTANNDLSICQQQEKTGDSVVILGYPDYAGQFTEPTATQGIISGYASPYYTTSAQIESGNSGGVAIDINKDCYIGIPSAVEIGNYANLGRILNANVPYHLPY